MRSSLALSSWQLVSAFFSRYQRKTLVALRGAWWIPLTVTAWQGPALWSCVSTSLDTPQTPSSVYRSCSSLAWDFGSLREAIAGGCPGGLARNLASALLAGVRPERILTFMSRSELITWATNVRQAAGS